MHYGIRRIYGYMNSVHAGRIQRPKYSDGCAFMFKGCDKLNELAHYYNIYKKSNQGTMWKRQVIQFMTCMRDWDISLCNDQHVHTAVGYTCKVW